MQCAGFSLWWLLLLWSMVEPRPELCSGVDGLSCSVGRGIFPGRDWICVPWIGRLILICFTTREVSECCYKPVFSLSSFTFIKRLFSSSSPSAIRVVSSAYLRSLIFLPAILIPVCASSSPTFHMIYSALKLNKRGDNIRPWCTPFPIWNQPVVPCLVLTVASWPDYRFLRRQVRWSGIPISWRIFHSLLWSTQSKTLEYVALFVYIIYRYVYFVYI